MPSAGSPRKKILISAYAISPYLGSEYGIAWNFVTRLSAFYDITVLYGTAGKRMGNNAEIVDYIKKNGSAGVTYVYVRPNLLVLFLDWLNFKINPIFFSLSHLLWQRQVLTVARQLVKSENYDLAHQLGPGGFRHPGFLWKLKMPFVWGPVRGTSSLNKIFFPMLGKESYFHNVIRNLSNIYYLKFSRKIKKVSRLASAIFCSTFADQKNFKKFLSVECPVIRENSIINLASSIKKSRSRLKFVWAGSVDDRKALNLLIEGLSRLPRRSDWTLHVVGDGPSKEKCMSMSRELGVASQIVWHGHVKHERVLEIMGDADVHILTSIMEGNPTVLFEAFEMCIPTIALDHLAMGELIDEHNGFKIKVTTLDEIVSKLSECINYCLDNPEVLDRMKYRILETQSALHWDVAIQRTCEIYEKVFADD
jgi:glycosyltransferase involved in cell wall biosynthesis